MANLSSETLSCFLDVNTISAWMGIISISASLIVWIWGYRKGIENKELKNIENGHLQALTATKKLLGRAKKRIDAFRRLDPRSWPKSLDSTDSALDLERKFEHVARYIKKPMARLADYYLDQILYTPETALKKSLRYARLAFLMDESDLEQFNKLVEIEAIQAFLSEWGELNTSSTNNYSTDSDADISPHIVTGYVSGLIQSGRNYAIENDRMFEVLLRRARAVALRHLDQKHELTIIARQLWAEAIYSLGLHLDAITELEDILPDVKEVFGPISQRVLEVMVAMHWALSSLARTTEADRLASKIKRLERRLAVVPPTREEQSEHAQDMDRVIALVLKRAEGKPPRPPHEDEN